MQEHSDCPYDNDPIALRIKELVSENRGVSVKKLKWEDSLYQDLCLYGDDVPDFFEEFVKEFNVDMTGFKFERYFPDEALSSFNPFKGILVWCSKSHRWPEPYEPITIFDLVQIARDEKWELSGLGKCDNSTGLESSS